MCFFRLPDGVRIAGCPSGGSVYSFLIEYAKYKLDMVVMAVRCAEMAWEGREG